MAMLLPVRPIVLLLTRLPFTVSACASRIVALLPPFTGPATASAMPSFSTKLAAVKLPRVADLVGDRGRRRSGWSRPSSCPLSVPAISVPVSPIVPVVAIRLVRTTEPAFTKPVIMMLLPVRLTVLVLTSCRSPSACRHDDRGALPPITGPMFSAVCRRSA